LTYKHHHPHHPHHHPINICQIYPRFFSAFDPILGAVSAAAMIWIHALLTWEKLQPGYDGDTMGKMNEHDDYHGMIINRI
jgi:hypothetical protein